MAMHYFHFLNGTVALDAIGRELANLQAVRKEAIRAVRELLSVGDSEELWAGDPWKVWVTDEPDAKGRTILTVEVSAP
jgi:hypothetical protein